MNETQVIEFHFSSERFRQWNTRKPPLPGALLWAVATTHDHHLNAQNFTEFSVDQMQDEAHWVENTWTQTRLVFSGFSVFVRVVSQYLNTHFLRGCFFETFYSG